MERVEEMLAEQPQTLDGADLPHLAPVAQQICFEQVGFSYGDSRPALDRVTLRIKAGEHIAIVGPSGSGKSTLCNLLLRFHDPDHGTVLIDGQDLRHVSRESLLAQIGVVFQETVLFHTSIRENIRLGRQDATDAEVEAAARAVALHDFILTLPQGYATQVGERGNALSGGQRQRLALARALLRRPAILLLDEATSALDPQTEAAIMTTLQEFSHHCTVIQVTHRLTSAAQADHIYLLDQGRLVQHGSHEVLLAQEGRYRQLWQHQGAPPILAVA